MTYKNIDFVNKRVGVKVDEVVKTTPGGIRILNPKQPNTGIVKYSSPSTSHSYSPGEKVLFGERAGYETEINGEKIRVLEEDEIIAVLS